MDHEDVTFRAARDEDLPAVVALLADDELGRDREDPRTPLDPRYLAAFEAIRTDPNQLQVVAVTADGEVVGTLQLSFVPGLTRTGAWRATIEGVRVSASRRGSGLGRRMFAWAIAVCDERGCELVQLTTDRARPEAHRFYERLGFVATHVGFKLDR